MALATVATPNLTFTLRQSPPPNDFRVTQPCYWYIASNACWTAVVNYIAPDGLWAIQWNFLPLNPVRTNDMIFGQDWVSLTNIVGPLTGSSNLAIPREPHGFMRLKQI